MQPVYLMDLVSRGQIQLWTTAQRERQCFVVNLTVQMWTSQWIWKEEQGETAGSHGFQTDLTQAFDKLEASLTWFPRDLNNRAVAERQGQGWRKKDHPNSNRAKESKTMTDSLYCCLENIAKVLDKPSWHPIPHPNPDQNKLWRPWGTGFIKDLWRGYNGRFHWPSTLDSHQPARPVNSKTEWLLFSLMDTYLAILAKGQA